MLQLTPQTRILLATEPVDFRKGIDGLAAVCRRVLTEQPLSGTVFVFRNRAGTALKLLCYDGQGFWLSLKRQNTSISESHGGQVTIIDATHPLYGCTLPLVRTPSPHSKAQLFVQLPDGRVQKLPRKVTDFEAATSTPRPHALIAVPTLVPLARLLCAMLAGKEDVCHDTDPTLIRPCDATSDQLPTSDLVAPARQPPSAPTGPLPLRADPTDTGCELPRCQGALS
jgi:hypothetical protein